MLSALPTPHIPLLQFLINASYSACLPRLNRPSGPTGSHLCTNVFSTEKQPLLPRRPGKSPVLPPMPTGPISWTRHVKKRVDQGHPRLPPNQKSSLQDEVHLRASLALGFTPWYQQLQFCRTTSQSWRKISATGQTMDRKLLGSSVPSCPRASKRRSTDRNHH